MLKDLKPKFLRFPGGCIVEGHPEPFNLVYLGRGNEQWIDYEIPNQDKYFETYEIFRARIKAKYPDIQLITTSGPFSHGKAFDTAWGIITDKTKDYIKENQVYAELIDEHYYMSPEWFLENDERYDSLCPAISKNNPCTMAARFDSV